MHVWRLQRSVYNPLDGEGARRYGGRWSRAGRPVVYVSESVALSILEILVHLDSDLVPADYAIFCIEIPDYVRSEIVDRSELPEDWHHAAVCRECLERGESWLDRGATVLLKVPSAVVPHGWNYLINPGHEEAAAIHVLSEEPFAFDGRLL